MPNELFWQGKIQLGVHPESKKQVVQIIAEVDANEHFYGLGERLNGFDQKGKVVTIQLSDAWSRSNELAYKAVPFYMSSHNYGLLVNTPERVIFDMANANSNQSIITLPGQALEMVFFANVSPLKVMEQFTDITGKSPVIPSWSLEPWLSRRRHTGWTNTKYCKL